ncbi:MAG: hypothetical protein ACLUOI_40900 [Eisenbergiella sp.]
MSLGKLFSNRISSFSTSRPTIDMESIMAGRLSDGMPDRVIVAGRYFLDRVVTKIIELDNGKATTAGRIFRLVRKKRCAGVMKACLNQRQRSGTGRSHYDVPLTVKIHPQGGEP